PVFGLWRSGTAGGQGLREVRAEPYLVVAQFQEALSDPGRAPVEVEEPEVFFRKFGAHDGAGTRQNRGTKAVPGKPYPSTPSPTRQRRDVDQPCQLVLKVSKTVL